MRLVVAPWLKLEERLSDLHDWRRFGERLEAIDARLRGEGLNFAWNSHELEFQRLPNGIFPIEILLDCNAHYLDIR